MPGHGGITFVNHGVPRSSTRSPSDEGAYQQIVCPHCGLGVNGAVVAWVQEPGSPDVKWIRCTSCQCGVVSNASVLAPSPLPGEAIEGLPPEVEAAYDEARRSAGVRAFTASELMCRKLLMHVAVDKGDAPNKTFAQYLTFLTNSGFITRPMKPWVDLIRQHGNISTHEIPPADEARALGTLAFTAQLLKLVYEMDHKVQAFMGPVAPSSTQP